LSGLAVGSFNSFSLKRAAIALSTPRSITTHFALNYVQKQRNSPKTPETLVSKISFKDLEYGNKLW
ncbi:MAG: hypothetical protein ACE5I8_12320, partial [Thermodesulfobacteriota bacterium]